MYKENVNLQEKSERTFKEDTHKVANDSENEEITRKLVSMVYKMDLDEQQSLFGKLSKEPIINIVESYIERNYEIRRNTIRGLPEHKPIGSKEDYEELNLDSLNRELQKKKISFSISKLASLLKSDFVKEWNPFVEYFKDLPEWKEGYKDYIKDLCGYIQTTDQERLEKQLKKWFVRTVACSINSKVVNKQCLILKGIQNDGKSTLCRFFVPQKLNDYIQENINTDKDSLIALSENFLINLDELSTLNKSEVNALKSIFSKDMVKVRRPYDAKTTNAERVCSFVGSTNNDEFLSDETGSVRWLIFEVKSIDFDYSKYVNMDLVYSQAYALYESGFDYQMTKAEIQENEDVNQKYFKQTSEIEAVMACFGKVEESEDVKNNRDIKFYQAVEVQAYLTEYYEKTIKFNKQNIGRALTKLNHRKGQEYRGKGYQVKGYYLMPLKGRDAPLKSLNNAKKEEDSNSKYPKEWDSDFKNK